MIKHRKRIVSYESGGGSVNGISHVNINQQSGGGMASSGGSVSIGGSGSGRYGSISICAGYQQSAQ